MTKATDFYHRSCQHDVYKMSCRDFDDLYARSGGACQMCGLPEEETPRGRLVIDHAREYGMRAVRGLLCDKCNALMRRVDNRERYDPVAARYCASAWFLRDREDELWRAAQEKATEQGTTVSAVIRDALVAFVDAAPTETRHNCEPPSYPTGADQNWTCPDCGRAHESFYVNADPRTPERIKTFLAGPTWGWISLTP